MFKNFLCKDLGKTWHYWLSVKLSCILIMILMMESKKQTNGCHVVNEVGESYIVLHHHLQIISVGDFQCCFVWLFNHINTIYIIYIYMLSISHLKREIEQLGVWVYPRWPVYVCRQTITVPFKRVLFKTKISML